MVFVIEAIKEPIYFIKKISMTETEYIFIRFYKDDKIRFFSSNDKIKIKIKKFINQKSYEGENILYNLGYNMKEYEKIIFKCRFLKKCKIFNKKICDVLFIIINYNGSMMLYKYDIQKNNKYVYNSTLLEDKENYL